MVRASRRGKEDHDVVKEETATDAVMEEANAAATATATATATSEAEAETEVTAPIPPTDAKTEEVMEKAAETAEAVKADVIADADANANAEAEAPPTKVETEADVTVAVDADPKAADASTDKKEEVAVKAETADTKDSLEATPADGIAAGTTTATATLITPKEEEKQPTEEDNPNAIWAPSDFDVLSGRGASVNSHGGNKKFRGLCFAHKPHFEAGNHAAKRRIATEIVDAVLNNGEARFLKRKTDKGAWFELTKEQAILKACQVMRDYKRPDRIAQREALQASGQARKRTRQVESTPMTGIEIPEAPSAPIVENPFGVHDHDILCGRGAFVNGHVGNQRLRKLALERKAAFDSGNYTEKRSLASEIVAILKALDPPGRFLKRASKKEDGSAPDKEWEELNDEKSIHKACQVMRDIDRPDRKDREERRLKKKQKILEKRSGLKAVSEEAEKAAVAEAVAATEQALDKALDVAENKTKEEVEKPEEKAVEV